MAVHGSTRAVLAVESILALLRELNSGTHAGAPV
jgi:hypothetical protein